MQAELRKQALVAAELARQSGFDETHKALLSIAGELTKKIESESGYNLGTKLA
jgi:hypothetical protein